MLLRVLLVTAAAWLGGGAVAEVSSHAARFGVTPSIWWLLPAAAAALAVRRWFLPVVAAVLLLPWLPLPVPAAFLAWTGHAAVWLWLLVGAGVVVRWGSGRGPRGGPALAFATAAVLYLVAAWHVSPHLPVGDEPHYLVITQSLLKDHDLRIENNHRDGDYHAYFPGALHPDYLQRGRDGAIYSIHAPGLPVIVAPAFALFGYRGVIVFLALLNAAAAALAWSAAYRVSKSASAAWFGWAAVALSEPFFAQAFMVYPDATAGAIVMFGVSTLLLGADASLLRLAATGAALAVLPWLHTRAAILAVTLGAALALRQPRERWIRRAAALLATPVVSAAAWFAFFYAIYGTPDPRAPYGGSHQMSLASLPHGLVGLLFDQQFGILPNAPVYLCVAVGLAALWRRAPRLAVELVAVLAPYTIAVAAFEMWWAGYTTPARFLVPTLLPLAIPAAVWFDAQRGVAARICAFAALAVSVLVTMTVVWVDRGALLLNFRNGSSGLLVWLSPAVDLTRGLPSLFQRDPSIVLLEGGVWLAAVALTVALTMAAARRLAGAERVAVAFGASAAAMAMIALTVVWRTNHTSGVNATAGVAAVLRTFDADARQIKLRLSPFRPVRSRDLLARMPIADDGPSDQRPLVSVADAPAGTYAIDLDLGARAEGRVSVALDRSLGPAWTFDVGANRAWSRTIAVPIASPALIVDADSRLRAAIAHVTLRAVDVPGSAHRAIDGEAKHAERDGSALLFLLGGEAFEEPGGVWVQGGASAELAVLSDDRRPVRMLIRTPPVANRVAIDGAGWHQDVILAPGASQIVDVQTPRFTVHATAGARPVDFAPASEDGRFLGCWIEVR